MNEVTYRDVLAEPVFRVLFWTRSAAIGADTLRTVALSVLVFTSTGSAFLGALTFGASFLPQAIGGLAIGALPDLVRPRLLIVGGYLVEAAGAATLALAGPPVWTSLLIVAGIGCLAPAFNGTAGRLTAESLTGDAFVLGRSLFQLASSAAQLLGLALGGVAAATLGPEGALLAAAAVHLGSALAARTLLPNLPAPDRDGGRALLRRSWQGNRELLGDPVVRRLLLVMWLPPAFITGAESLLVPYALLHGFPDAAPGLLLACVPVGMFAGNLVVARLLSPPTRERTVPVLVALLGAPLLPFAFDIGIVLAGVLLVLTGVGFAYGLGLQRRFREAVPAETTGQGFGLMSTGLMTLQGVGPAAFGLLTEVVPVGVSMALGGLAAVLASIWIGSDEMFSRNESTGSVP
ncbi:MFS transporter [Actinophytocola xanthii]|uniref:MFS transporter n=1 Tax=Actinophytocola xanthii TaxID=1912961 RepID=A0A1Q8C0U1_9PSEU|nr:MFS transporter [Actinophytocola xanthii]OLF07968.1 MFS transporter [Actinophytocola xanthii]